MRIIRKFKKNEKGSITIMVLASMLFILVIIITSYLSISNKSIGQGKKILQISKQYQVKREEIEQEYNYVYNRVDFTNGLGDINLDEYIEQGDVDLLNQYLDGIYEFDNEQKLRADINKDQQITEADLTNLEEYINNLDSTET